MIEIPVYTEDGKSAGTLPIDEQLLGGEIRPVLLKQAYVMYHANRRQGSASNRNRSRKEGSTRKIYRQKGTGNARMGTNRTNLRRGGGVAFVKQPKDWRKQMPVKMRRLASRNALLAKLVDQEVRVVDKIDFDQPKTSRFAKMLSALGVDRSSLVALSPTSRNVLLSARNIEGVSVIQVDQLNAYDMLSKRFVVIEKDALVQWIDSMTSKSAVGQKETA